MNHSPVCRSYGVICFLYGCQKFIGFEPAFHGVRLVFFLVELLFFTTLAYQAVFLLGVVQNQINSEFSIDIVDGEHLMFRRLC